MTARYFESAPERIPDIDTLVDVLIFEVTQHFKLAKNSFLYGMIDRFAQVPAKRFARVMQWFDQAVADSSIWEAAKMALLELTKGLEVKGLKKVPCDGPLLVVANHPGSADSVAAMAAIERPDQSMVVIERPMLLAMPNFSRHMIYVDEDNPQRFSLIKKVIQKLKEGQTVITFPRGNLEPDPSLIPGAIDSVNNWSESIGLFLSQVPDTMVQPLLISDVLVPRAWNSALARRAKSVKVRQQITMVLQIAMQQLFPKSNWKIPIKVTATECIAARELSGSLDPHEMYHALTGYIKDQIGLAFPDQIEPGYQVNPGTR